MSSSDMAMFQALVDRVEKLEQQVTELMEHVTGRDVSGDVLGPEADKEERDGLRTLLKESRKPGPVKMPNPARNP